MLHAKQKGFTLLELLVVITLLALLSVGALVVYDGVTDKASDATSANNIVVLNRALRQVAVVNNGQYPDQWDSIFTEVGTEPCWDGQKNPNLDLASGGDCDGGQPMLADVTKSFIRKFTFVAEDTAGPATISTKTALALKNVGIRTLQTIEDDTPTPLNVVSGLVFNEGGNSGVAEETGIIDDDGIVEALTIPMIPSASVDEGVVTACTLGGAAINQAMDGTQVTSQFLNKITDRLEEDECHFVVALGIGHDVGGWGAAGTIGLDTAPTYNSRKVNAAYNYSRFLGLFALASVGAGEDITADDIHENARFVGVIDPEGRTADEAISGAFSSQTN